MLESVNVLSCCVLCPFNAGIMLSNMVACLTNVIIVFINMWETGHFLISELISVWH